MITHGKSSTGIYYIIMERYGPSLKTMLRQSKYERFSIKSAIQIGRQLIDRLETLHNVGLIHYDLKPDNLLLLSGDKTRIESSEIVLIDFGESKFYLDEAGRHLPLRDDVAFAGNLMF
jgi:casein kinase 1